MPGELDEIWELYADDGAQSLDLVEQSLLNLKETPANAGHIAALFRAIHTFKGNARVLGLGTIEHCAHAAEDLIGLVRDENVPLTPDLLVLLLEISDVLREMMNESLARRADPAPEGSKALVARIQAKIEECRAVQRGEPSAASPEPEAIVFEPVKEAALAQDTGYLQIFTGMASDGLSDACAVLDKLQAGEPLELGVLTQSLEPLRFAAGQMGLPGWMELLGDFLSKPAPSASDLEALIAGMERLMPGEKAPAGLTNLAQPEEPAQAAPAGPEAREEDLGAAPASSPGAARSDFHDLKNFGAVVLAPVPGDTPGGPVLSSDPTYRAIFLDMVHDILREMEAALAEFETDPLQGQLTLASHVDRLTHAARQIGMSGWLELLAEYPRDREVSLEEAHAFFAKVAAQTIIDTEATYRPRPTGDVTADSPVCKFFEGLPLLLSSVSSFGSLLINGNPVDETAFLAAIARIGSMAASLEFVRIADLAERMAKERQYAAFRRLELRLYEELVSVEQELRAHLPELDFKPAAVLENWCADQAYDTLIDLGHTLERMRKRSGTPDQCEDTADLLRLIYYACRHYELETAAHLSMSLIDLFARARDDGTVSRSHAPAHSHVLRRGPRSCCSIPWGRRHSRHGGDREAI